MDLFFLLLLQNGIAWDFRHILLQKVHQMILFQDLWPSKFIFFRVLLTLFIRKIEFSLFFENYINIVFSIIFLTIFIRSLVQMQR
jgi:hypothetical protein